MSDRFVQKLTGGSAIAYIVLLFVGSSIGGSSPDLGASRGEIARWAAGQQLTVAHAAGGFCELLGLLALIVFAASAFAFFRSAEGGNGALSATVLGAALTSAAVKLASAGPAFAVYWRAKEGMSPQLTTALIDANNFAFVLTWAIDSVLLAAAAALILRTHVLPRWTGWLAAVTAPLLLLSTPVADVVPPLGMLLGFVWFLAIGFVLAFRRSTAAVRGAAVTA